jgi:Cu-Zn family superoxide dismutase
VAQADTTIQMNMVDQHGVGKAVGQVVVSESAYGLVFTPALAGLPAGLHGFHVHENASCSAKEKDGNGDLREQRNGRVDTGTFKRMKKSTGSGLLPVR